MIHLIAARSCAEAWLKGANLLVESPGRFAYNVILDIEEPTAETAADRLVFQAVDRFLVAHEADSVDSVVETIFPAAQYRQRGAAGVLEYFPEHIYPKLTKNWGTYAGRILVRQNQAGERINPLAIVIEKLQRQLRTSAPLRSAYEISLVDVFSDLPIHEPALDARRTLNQPCLVHLSFKLREQKGLMVTALYRSHYYVQRVLGNLVGLAQLLSFVARESGTQPGSLVCHSTFARLETDKRWTIRELDNLVGNCNRIRYPRKVRAG